MYPSPPLFPALPAQAFDILLALSRGEAHGYAIGAIAFNDSLGAVRMPDSSLYKLLQKLTAGHLIEESGLQPAGKSGKERMHYRLTREGKYYLEEEAKRLRYAVQVALLNNP